MNSYIFFSMAQQLLVGQDLIIEASRSYSYTPQSIGQSQQAIGHRPTPKTARLLGSATSYITWPKL